MEATSCKKCSQLKCECNKKCSTCSKSKDKCKCVKSRCKRCNKAKEKCSCSDEYKCGCEGTKCKKCTGCGFTKCKCKCADQGYCARDIFEKHRDAVVRIQTEFSLTTSGYVSGLPRVSPVFTIYGNGFFISGKRVVCPASLVLIPPSLLSTLNRFPFVSASVTAPTGVMPNTLTKVNRILVEIDNPEELPRSDPKSKRTYVYEAILSAVDGAGDSAVLRFKLNSPWNSGLPCLKRKKSYLSWGRSRSYCIGNKVFAIGDPYTAVTGASTGLGGGKNAILEGIVTNDNFVSHDGWAFPPMLAASFNVYAPRVGMPILDRWGRVVAMQTTNVPGYTFSPIGDSSVGNNIGMGSVAGPTQFFLFRVLEKLVCASKALTSNAKVPSCVSLQQDLLGSYYIYDKAYLGVAYNVLTGLDYDTNTSNGPRTENFTPSGQLPSGPMCKQLIGIKVVALGGLERIEGPFVPGSIPIGVFPSVVDSPLVNILNPGDIITFIGKCPVGDSDGQVAPALITWRAGTSKSLRIDYRSASSGYASGAHISITPAEFPGVLDYPWYALPNLELQFEPNEDLSLVPSSNFVPAL